MTQTARKEIDHLNTRDAFNALGVAGTCTGLGYNSGAVSYHWEISKNLDGSVVVTVEGTLVLEADLDAVKAAVTLPVCRLVSNLVQDHTGNCAVTLCNLLDN